MQVTHLAKKSYLLSSPLWFFSPLSSITVCFFPSFILACGQSLSIERGRTIEYVGNTRTYINPIKTLYR